MVTVGINYTVLPDKLNLFEQEFACVLDAMRLARGHRQSHLYRDVLHLNTYLVLSEWSSREDFQAFTKSEAYKLAAKWQEDGILAARPNHKVFKS